VALEARVRADVDGGVEVAGGAAARARLPLARQPEALARLDARGDRDLHLARGVDLAAPMALGAGGLRRRTLATAGRAGGAHHEHALARRDLAAPTAGGAGVDLPVLRARPVAGLAGRG